VILKHKISIIILSLFLVPVYATGEVVVDTAFQTPVFCENDRKTISYIIVSFNEDSFSKVTDLAYFTDGYPNIVGPDFYSASSSSVINNKFNVKLKKLVGSKASDFSPQKSGPLAKCTVTVSSDWRKKIKRIQDIEIFQTDDFDVKCSFPLDEREICKTSKPLAKNLYLYNPSNGKKLWYKSKFTYKTWE
jgi:hypothetical protein